MWTGQWITKLLDFLFWIGLQAASRGCRNLLRTSEREGATGTEPRIRTVRQLTAAAGDGLLGSVGSPGQLETSLNSGYQWAPATHTWRGPHPFILAAARAWRRRPPTSSSLADEERVGSLLLSTAAAPLPTLAADFLSTTTGAISLLSQPMRDFPTLAAHVPAPSPTGTARDYLALAAPRGRSGLLTCGIGSLSQH